MLHPRLTTIDGQVYWLAQVGPFGAWSDLQITTRWGEGACGMYEAQWTMPLPTDFEHLILRRGSLVELMDGAYRVGSPLILSEPARGTGIEDPWHLTATGIGREVEGQNSWYCDDGAGNTTSVPSTATDSAIANGLRWDGRDGTVATGAVGGTTTTDELMTLGSLFNAYGDQSSQRWRVTSGNLLSFRGDPSTPTYQVTPDAVALGTTDDDYATVVKFRYINSTTGLNTTVTSPASASATQQRFGRREYAVNRLNMGPMSSASAQGFADGILAKSKGRLAWSNGLTVTPNEILTMGGVPADLTKVLEDVGDGCTVRLNGISSDLLEYNGQTWLDIIIGQAQFTDGGQTIQLDPLGLAARNLAAIVEDVTGYTDAA